MLRFLFTVLSCFLVILAFAQHVVPSRDPYAGYITYTIADTVRAVTFHTEFSIGPGADKKDGFYTVAGFSRGLIAFSREGTERVIKMVIPDTVFMHAQPGSKAQLTAKGEHVNTADQYGQVYSWKYNWKTGTSYKVMVTALPDTATKTTIYAGYVFLPESAKWKLIASTRVSLDGDFLRGLYAVTLPRAPIMLKENKKPERPAVKENIAVKDKTGITDTVAFVSAWLQRSNGSWMELSNRRPVIDLAKNIDSAAQVEKDRQQVFAAVRNKQLDTTGSIEGVYYHILKQGTGDAVSVNDTVTVFYKGSLLQDGSIFDQTKDKPATFPLRRLIRGWQLAIPMCRVGGTVRIIIPSGQAYGIRARSKDIPPNSVLVFDVEVAGVKKPAN